MLHCRKLQKQASAFPLQSLHLPFLLLSDRVTQEPSDLRNKLLFAFALIPLAAQAKILSFRLRYITALSCFLEKENHRSSVVEQSLLQCIKQGPRFANTRRARDWSHPPTRVHRHLMKNIRHDATAFGPGQQVERRVLGLIGKGNEDSFVHSMSSPSI